MGKAFDISILEEFVKDIKSVGATKTDDESRGKPIRELDAMHEAEQRAMEVYKEYQYNILKAGELSTAITKGIDAEENPYIIILLAVEALSLMTDNKAFLDIIREKIKAKHGVDLAEPALLLGMEEITGMDISEVFPTADNDEENDLPIL